MSDLATAERDGWVTAAAALPIAFAQVREDPRIDREIIARTDAPARALMIASGGETAAVLATLPIESLHVVDASASQIALTRLKLSLLAGASTEQRLMLLGHRSMDIDDRHRELQRSLSQLELPHSILGPEMLVAQHGPDFCARYEWVFAQLRNVLSTYNGEMEDLLTLSDTQIQTERVSSSTVLGQHLESAFDQVMQQPNLVAIFGEDATANPAMPFSKHFMAQTRNALARFDAADNPFLHQLFLGRFITETWDWFDLPQRSDICPIQFSVSRMKDLIKSLPDRSYHFIHLSNILDWVSPLEAKSLLFHAHRCLTPGGMVVIRQLNSTLNIAAVPCGLTWQHELSEELGALDRSFFYRELHIGRRT